MVEEKGAEDASELPAHESPEGANSGRAATSIVDSDTITRIDYQGREVYVIGTAHISQRSVEEVVEVIHALKPEVVCVELDQMRFESLTDETRWQKLDIFEVVKQKKVLFLLASLVLSAYQRKMGDALGVKPGAELLAGVKAADEVGAKLVLADRNIQATLKRTWRSLSFFNKGKVLAGLSASFFGSGEITEEQIEELKDKDNISNMMKEFAKAFPQIKTPLIDERDLYLISATLEAALGVPEGSKIVSIVGAGHVEGMVANVDTEVDREALSEIPPPPLSSRLIKWVIPLIVIAFFAKGYNDHQGEGLLDILYAWVLPNAFFAALFGVAAGAKFLTIIAAAIFSPITSLNPALPLGVITGYIEARLRRPTVADCEKINEASKSVSGIYRNPFTRVLLVAVLTILGSAVGGWIGLVSVGGWQAVLIALGLVSLAVVVSQVAARIAK